MLFIQDAWGAQALPRTTRIPCQSTGISYSAIFRKSLEFWIDKNCLGQSSICVKPGWFSINLFIKFSCLDRKLVKRRIFYFVGKNLAFQAKQIKLAQSWSTLTEFLWLLWIFLVFVWLLLMVYLRCCWHTWEISGNFLKAFKFFCFYSGSFCVPKSWQAVSSSSGLSNKIY